MKICIQGLWHLGSVTAACMASFDNQVVGLDFDTEVVESLLQGNPPIFEPGLQNLLNVGLQSGKLTFTSDPAVALRDCEILWIAYDTPVDEDDNADVNFVISQIEHSLEYVRSDILILVSSQMPVGSIRRLEEIAAHFPDKQISFACSPENLRLGKALTVFQNPDRIVIGVRHSQDKKTLQRLLLPITSRLEWMSVESAEMTKHAINAFLAISVTFANEIAAICELVGADGKEVERGLKSENRIGLKAYLSPGAAFAGGTLARDITFLNNLSNEKILSTPLLSSVKQSNNTHKEWIRRKLLAMFPDLSQCSIALWGLTYKPGTNTLRRSMAVELGDWLILQGADIHVHDPAVEVLPKGWAGNITQCSDPLEALSKASILIVCTEWPEYREIEIEEMKKIAPGLTIFDANRFLSAFAEVKELKYVAVGTPQ